MSSVVLFENDAPGVYLLGDASEIVIYVGSANEIRRRLMEHLSESNTCIKRNAVKYRVFYTADYARQERFIYDEIVRVKGRPPMCNSVRPPGF